jgi:hypothetical protein
LKVSCQQVFLTEWEEQRLGTEEPLSATNIVKFLSSSDNDQVARVALACRAKQVLAEQEE